MEAFLVHEKGRVFANALDALCTPLQGLLHQHPFLLLLLLRLLPLLLPLILSILLLLYLFFLTLLFIKVAAHFNSKFSAAALVKVLTKEQIDSRNRLGLRYYFHV